MSRLSTTLIGDHRHCDELFTQAENKVAVGDIATASEVFTAFATETERHFHREEAVLFPAFERTTGQTGGPTQVMRVEHARMRQLFDEMSGCLAQGDQERFMGLSETLLIMMQQHNAKEEQVLYPMSERVLGEHAENLLDEFDKI
jgi:hemerythrin-like domain-containing protein